MQIPPPISYAERDGASIAFQSFGEGEANLVVVSDLPSHLDLLWTDPGYVDVLLHLTASVHTVMYDRRGSGLSDPLDHVPTLEEEALDLEAVIDAAGLERASLMGYSASTAVAAYFAATRPERVDRLVMVGPFARGWDAESNLWTAEERAEERGKLMDALDHWGEGRLLGFTLPTLDNARNRRLWGMLERASASRGAARAMYERTLRLDLTPVLPSIQAQTLVVSHADIPYPRRVTAEVAELIPGAVLRHVEYDGEPTGVADFWNPVTDEINEFLTGSRAGGSESERMVASLLFTDIVGSTGHAARLGDREWRSLLSHHNDIVGNVVEEQGGRLIKTIGDGSLSTFDGPVGAIRCAEQLAAALSPLGIELRAGVHTGECQRVGLDVAGIAVHVAARVQAAAEPGEVLVTRAAAELCGGSGIDFAERGSHELKGVPGAWQLLSVDGTGTRVPLDQQPPELRISDRVVLGVARRAPGLLRRAAGGRRVSA